MSCWKSRFLLPPHRAEPCHVNNTHYIISIESALFG